MGSAAHSPQNAALAAAAALPLAVASVVCTPQLLPLLPPLLPGSLFQKRTNDCVTASSSLGHGLQVWQVVVAVAAALAAGATLYTGRGAGGKGGKGQNTGLRVGTVDPKHGRSGSPPKIHAQQQT